MPTLPQDRREMLTTKEWLCLIGGYVVGGLNVLYWWTRANHRRDNR